MSKSRAPRNTLDREGIVDATRGLLDAEGLEALTMRRLADTLGVRPMALYHHFRNKDELLNSVVESVFGEIYLPEPSGDWRAELATRSRSMREVLAAHPWALPLMETRTNPGSVQLKHHEAILETMRRSGFSVRAAAHGYAILDAFVYGFAFQEALLGSIGLDSEPEQLAEGLELSSRPRLAEMVRLYLEGSGFRFSDSFGVGLRLTLDGLGALRNEDDPPCLRSSP